MESQMAVLDGNCGVSGLEDRFQFAQARLPQNCCPDGCQQVIFSGTKIFSIGSNYSTPMLIVGNIPGTAIALFINGVDLGGGNYAFQLFIALANPPGDPTALGVSIISVTEEEHNAEEWLLSCSWCSDGVFRAGIQLGGAGLRTFDVNVSDFLDAPFYFGSMFMFLMSTVDALLQVSKLERVQTGCGSLPSGDPFILTEY